MSMVKSIWNSEKIAEKIISLPRFVKRGIMVMFDSTALILILLLSFSIRFGYLYFPEILNSNGNLSAIFWIIISAPFIAIPIFHSFNLYHSIIRFIGLKSMATVSQAITLYAVVWGLITYMIQIPGIPRSAILINWMLALLFIGGSRIFSRWFLVRNITSKSKKKKKVIIYGAGAAGIELSQTIIASPQFNHAVFIDDDESIQGRHINGIKVFSSSAIKNIVIKYEIDEILLAMPSLRRIRRKEIITLLSQMKIPVKSMPSMIELATGNVRIEDLREINIEDLLGRDSVKSHAMLKDLKITGKVVMVSGAGGSIGAELSRQLLLLQPKCIILYDINEFSLYKINSEIELIKNNTVEFVSILGSVKDRQRLHKVCQYFGVQAIFHAAAYKHVPMVEHNNSEGVLNNIIGTKEIAEVAIENKVETFVLISTDKAVRPTNTMGVTKRISELILQALAEKEHDTCFTMVRFGNVLDSSGSVIPLFKKQIKYGGPVTVTDINIVRYFMTKNEAIELVIQAGAMASGGDLFVLDMGNPVRIDDMARKMIELSGLTVRDQFTKDGDIEIQYTGLRPGEKLYEELLVGDNVSSTENPLIMRAKESFIDWEKLEPLLNKLEEAANNSDSQTIRELLQKIVPEFNPQCEIEDYLFKKKNS
ncbi:polysaccharide biosynthesis protein [Candidatus Thioglobus sp.]|nr:polysaccharide biosynthesis protein [Candidatus Thioglobus sp.]